MRAVQPRGRESYILEAIRHEMQREAAQKETPPETGQLGIFRDTVLHRADFRYAELDRRNPEARSILRAAKRVALARCDGEPESRPLELLEKRLRKLDTGDLNVLAVMVMAWHPNVRALATGQGGIWGMATEVLNSAARRLLRDRPMFEVVA